MQSIQKLKNKLTDKFYSHQLHAFFQWLNAAHTERRGTIYICLPTVTYMVDHNKRPVKESASIGIILCTPETRSAAFTETTQDRTTWYRTFTSPTLEVWEDVSRYTPEALPLRFGISDAERELLADATKKHLVNLLGGTSIPSSETRATISTRLHQYTDLDVALWVGGQLRGSIVLTNQSCLAGLQQAATLAAQDIRFKPLTMKDIPTMTIEISLISTLRIPLLERELTQAHIYPEKTYHTEIAGKEGWYLPTIFNCRPFRNLTELHNSLITEKVGVGLEKKSNRLTISETCTFIVHPESLKISVLNGPLLAYESASIPSLTTMQEHAVNYLAAIQEPDGNIPAIINPLSGQVTNFDVIRLAHCCFALLAYAKETNAEKALEVGQKSYQFLRHLFMRPVYIELLGPYERLLSLLYIHRAAVLENDEEFMIFLEKQIDCQSSVLPKEPIIQLQFIQYELLRPERVPLAAKITDGLYREYSTARDLAREISFASCADLLLCLETLYEVTGDVEYESKLDALVSWYLDHQLANGAFPDTTLQSYCYTRGTLKILETFSRVKKTKRLTTSPLPWIASMQYSDQSTFCVTATWRDKIIGGLRHDTHNATCWIDSASHLLLIKNTP